MYLLAGQWIAINFSRSGMYLLAGDQLLFVVTRRFSITFYSKKFGNIVYLSFIIDLFHWHHANSFTYNKKGIQTDIIYIYLSID